MAESVSIPLAPEQLNEFLNIRGLSQGVYGTPLRYFRCKLDKINGSMDRVGNMQESRLRLTYTFSELEVFQSIEPYNAPIGQVQVWYSNSPTSAMGALRKSIDRIVNMGVPDDAPNERIKVRSQDFLVGKVQEWKITPGHPVYNRDAKGTVPTDCWEVTWIEGIGGIPYSGTAQEVSAPAAPGITPSQQAMRLLDGKTQQEWNNIVFQDTLVKSSSEKGDTSLINDIINGRFIPSLKDAGLVTKDDNGIFHVKED